MKKRWFFTTLLAAAICVICLALFPTEAKAASVDDLTFELNSYGQSYTVTDCDTFASGALEIPSTYNGKPVTKIGSHAFYCCSSLTSITIPDSVTSIGNRAFYSCDRLTSVTIPDSVTSIDSMAFYSCSNLTSVTIGNGVTSIGDYAFEDCDSLTSVAIGNGVTFIGRYAFYNCSSLTDVYISNPSAWCNVTFENDFSDLMYYAERLHILDNNGNEATRIILDSTVTAIPDYAFKDCTSLTSITIPDSVTSIGDYAFEDCDSLTSITIPDSVTSIGNRAFYSCSNLTSVTIPDSVTSIGQSTFSGCRNLTSISIPDSVTSIGDYAFYNCSNLTSITIPDSVTSIGDDAFYGCKSLTSVTIGNGVTSIGRWAFSGCYSLTSVTIPNGVTSIDDYAFYSCDSLTGIWVSEGNPNYSSDAYGVLFNKAKTTLICAPEGLSGSYIIPDSVTSIGDYAFEDCNSLTSVTIGSGVTSIGRSAFSSCTSLTNVFYSGSESQWKKIDIDEYKGSLTTAKVHFKSTGKVIAKTLMTKNDNTDNLIVKTRTGDALKLTAKATGKGLQYQWQSSADGKTWKNCSSTDAKKSTFLFTLRTRHNNNYYRCKVTDSAGNTVYTNAVRLYVLGITTQPTTQKIKVGATAKLAVKAVGTGLKYQWQSSANGKTWKNCSTSTAKKATFSFISKTRHNGNYYRCKVTDSAGNVVYTDAVRLYVLGITTQPTTQKIKVGATAKLAVKAVGTGLKYQWQSSSDGKTWKNCSSSTAKKATFSFTSKTRHNGNYYRCKVTDSAGNVVYTDAVRLYVLGITTQPTTQKIKVGATAKLAVKAVGTGLKYQWQYSTDGGKTWKICSGTAAQKAAFSFKAKASQNGYYFRCKITDSAKNVIYTSKVKLTVKK